MDGEDAGEIEPFVVADVPPDGLLSLTISQLAHAADGARRGLKVYESLRNLNDVIGAEYGDRVVYELLQNAHDAHDRGRRDGEVTIRLTITAPDKGVLLIANRGRGFTFPDLDAIRNIGTSGKEIGESIGNKGLGFRSTEALTSDVRIYSQPRATPSDQFDGYCFRFAQRQEIAELLKDCEAHPDIRRRVTSTIPRYLTPLPPLGQPAEIAVFARDGFATVVELPLETEGAVALARKQVLALDSRDAPLMLFLRRLQAVNIEVSQPRKMGLSSRRTLSRRVDQVVEVDGIPGCSVETVDLAASGRFYVVRRAIDKAKVLEAVHKSIPSAPQLKRWLDWRGDPEVGVAVVQEGSAVRAPRLYNFLAMEDDAVAPLAGFVDAPFFTDIDRRNLKLDLPLNAQLMAEVAETCVAVGLARVAGATPLPPMAVVDLLAWQPNRSGQIIAALTRRGATLRGVEAWPLHDAAGSGWTSLAEAIDWSEQRTAIITAPRLAAAGAKVLSPRIRDSRLQRVRALAQSVNAKLKPAEYLLPEWIEAIAQELDRSVVGRGKVWPRFYDDVVGLYRQLNYELADLRGHRIMLDGQGDLRPAIGVAARDERPVYVRAAGLRRGGKSALPMPPSSLSRKLTFMSEEAMPSDATLAALEGAGLLRRYDAVEVLAALQTALGSTPTDIQRREVLLWAFRVSQRGAQGLDEALEEASLHVPAGGAWAPAADCIYSADWSSAGVALEAYLAEAAPYSEDCQGVQSRLIGSWADWPKAGDEALTDWKRFLDKLKVKDGLQPVPAEMPESGTWNDVWYAFLRHGLAKQGFDQAWVDDVRFLQLYYPRTDYSLDGEGWRLPGQLEHGDLPDGAKAKFSDLVVAYLRQQGDKHFRFRLGAYHRAASQQDVTTFPTPLQVFLRTEPWLAIYQDDEPVFRRPSQCWGSRSGRMPPRLVDRYQPDSTLGIPTLLYDGRIGLQDWSAKETAAARLSSLSSAADGLASTDRRDLREWLRRAWGDVVAAGVPIDGAPIVVEQNGVLQLLPGHEEAPPTVYVAREPNSFAARALGDRGQPVLDIGDTDAAAVVALLDASKRFVGRLAETGVNLLVDGRPFTPSAEDGFLVATPGLEWLPDGAALAYSTMGDPLEIRNVSAEVIERRMRTIRIHRCKRLSLVVGDVEAVAHGADRIQAFPHNSRPTLIIAGEAPMSWPLLLEAAPALSKLLGSGVKSLEMMLLRLNIQSEALAQPSWDRLAHAVERSVDYVREHFEASEGGVARRIEAVMPVVHYAGGDPMVDQLRAAAERHGPRLQLAAWIGDHCEGLDGERVVQVTTTARDNLHVQRDLGLDFGRFNRSLRALGRPGLNDEAELKRLFEYNCNLVRSPLLDRVRRRHVAEYQQRGDLAGYRAHQGLGFVRFNQAWLDEVATLDASLVETWVAGLADEALGPDTGPALQPLDQVLDGNRKLVARRLPNLAALVSAWSTANGRGDAGSWGDDPTALARSLEQSGALDFELLQPNDLPAVLQWQGLWPKDMPATEDLQVLGLTADQLREQRRRAQEAKQAAEVAKRSIVFAGITMDPDADDFQERMADSAIAQMQENPDWFDRSRALRLAVQEEEEQSRGGGGGGPGGKTIRKQPPEGVRRAMGVASEYLAREYLRRKYPAEMNDDCWVSTNRAYFCSGKVGDDALGYDFRIVTARNEWLYEVKSAMDAGGEFEITANELAVAGSAAAERKRRYRILYVPYVFDPTRWCVLTIGNPTSASWRKRLKIVRRGSVRYSFDQR